jgi:hypothetical protein
VRVIRSSTSSVFIFFKIMDIAIVKRNNNMKNPKMGKVSSSKETCQ